MKTTEGAVTMSDLSKSTRLYRENMLADSYRPGYHFAIPDGDGRPGDPNGAFCAGGLYHLMYLYRSEITGGFHWGHMTSHDLLHWRQHKDAIGVHEEDGGCFSGGAFVDDDGTAYLTFWKFPSKDFKTDNGGIAIAYSKPPYEEWSRIEPIAINGNRDPWGTVDIGGEHIACADPSNIWKKDGVYYMQTGNLCVLNKWGRDPDSDPGYKGDWVDLFRSDDLKNWEFVKRFYSGNPKDNGWPDDTEDDMCPSFLPAPDKKEDGKLTDTMLQVFIAHNKGAQYYLGRLSDDGLTFTPEKHGRFSWTDNTCFAPECLIDDRNRHICWYWLLDNIEGDFDKFGWTGVYSFPRCLWVEDGELHMAPASELDRLQINRQTVDIGQAAEEKRIPVKNGESFRIKAEISVSGGKTGFSVRNDSGTGEKTLIYYDNEEKKIVMDTSLSGAYGRKTVEKAPFELKDGEKLSLDIFVDKSVIEVYANERQAIVRRVYPTDPKNAVGVHTMGNGDFGTVTVWEMTETNWY